MKIKNKLILTFLFISFLNIRASHFSLDNEIKTIQTLPRKPQGVTLDIEVTKVKTEKINASIDEKNKKIKIDFTDKKNENVKKLVAEEKQYDIFVFDNPNDISFFSTTGKKDKRSALKLPKLYDYNVDEKNNNVISINYEEKPETLYVGVRDKNNNEVVKIYNTEITPYETFQVVISNGLAINNPVLLSTTSTVYAYPFRKNNGSLIRPEIIKSGDAGDGTQPGTKYSASENSLEPISTYGMIEEFNWTLGNNLTVSGYPLSNFEGISVTRVDRISTIPARLRFMNGNADISNNVSYKKWNRSAAANISAFLIQGDKPQRHLLFGMNSWDLSKQLVYTQFAAPLTPPTSIGSYQQTYISIPPFDPEAYYDNISSSIKIDRTLTNNGTANPNMSTFWSAGLRPNYNHPPNHTGDHIQKTDVQNKTIELGTIKIFNSTDIPQIASDQLGKPLKFHAPTSKITLSDGSGNTITGNIFIEGNLSEITAEEARTVKKVYLELDELKNGTFSTADNIEILRLGLQTDNIFDDIISKITLTIAAPVNVQVKNAINLSNPVALTSSSDNLTSGEGIYPLNIGGNFTAKNYSGGAPTGYQGVQAIQGYIDGGNLGSYGLIENANWTTGQINVSGIIKNNLPISSISFLPSSYVNGMSIVERTQDSSLQRSYFRFGATVAANTVDPPPEKKWFSTSVTSSIWPFLSESGSGSSSYLSFGFIKWNYKINQLILKYTLSANSNSYQETYINIPPFEPEAYYDNVNSSIKIDGANQNIDTMNFWNSSSATNPSYNHNVNGKTIHAGAEIELTNPSDTMIELGTIRARDLFYASDFQGDILKFYTSGSSIDLIDSTNNTNKITGQIIIKVNGAEYNEYAAKDLIIQSATVYLKLPGALPSSKFGDFVIASDSTKNILRLGLKAGGIITNDIYDDIISKITLKIPVPTPFTVENSIVLANPFAVSNSAAKAYPMNGVGNFYAESSPGGNNLTISSAKGILGAGAQMGSYGLLEDTRWKSGDVNITGDVNGNSFTFLPGDFGNGITKIERIQNSGNLSYLAFKNSTGTEVIPSAASKTVNFINFFLTQYSTPSKHLNVGFGAENTWNGTQRKITLSIKNSFNQEQKTYIHVPPLDPEAFYDNAGAGIKIDNTDRNIDTLNFWTNTNDLQNPTYVHTHTGAQITRSDVANPGDFSGDGLTINLGTIKSKDVTAPYTQSNTLNYFTSPDGIITLTENSTGKTITGRIYIEQDGVLYAPPFELTRAITPRTVYLKLDRGSLKNGTFIAGSNINILGLGSGSYFDRIIDILTVTLTKIPNPTIKLESAIVINNPVALAKNSNITYPFKNNEGNGSKIEPRIINNSGGAIDNNYIYSATRRGDNIGNYGLVNNTEWITEFININGYTPSSIPGVIITDIKRVANSINTNLEFYNGNTLQNISGKKWNGNTLSGMGDFLIEGTTNGKHLTMGFSDWDLKEKTFEFKYLSVSNPQNREGIIYITLPPFDPEAYYDNGSSTIKIDGQSGDIDTTNFWSNQTSLKPTYTNHIHNGAIIKKNFVINKKINLGTIKILDEIFIPDIASDLLGKPLKFYTTDSITLVDRDNSNNKITGKIYIENTPGSEVSEIDAKDTRIAKNVYLELDTLKKGTFIIDNAEILRLGIPTDGIFDDIISKIELTILINSSFIIDYEPKILDFGAVIENQFSANEAKTRINITYDTDLNNPNFTYELQKDDGSKTNYYNDFKLYQNGDKTSTNFAIADLWLGIEGTPNSNEPNKKTLDLNGRLKNINNAPILGGTSTTYKNIVNIIVTLEEAP
ncbi:hypothetical protein [Cetobacterium somerae]